jgi:hypothetical protein
MPPLLKFVIISEQVAFIIAVFLENVIFCVQLIVLITTQFHSALGTNLGLFPSISAYVESLLTYAKCRRISCRLQLEVQKQILPCCGFEVIAQHFLGRRKLVSYISFPKLNTLSGSGARACCRLNQEAKFVSLISSP